MSPAALSPEVAVSSKGPRPPTHQALLQRPQIWAAEAGSERLPVAAEATLPPSTAFTSHLVRHVPGSHRGWLRWF